MPDFIIKKGFDIGLEGRPATSIVNAVDSPTVTVHPLEHHGLKQRLIVDEGAEVKRGTILMEDKRDPRFTIRAPAAGTVQSIVRGERRRVCDIVIAVAREDAVESFPSHAADALAGLSRDAVLEQLQSSGYLALVEQRPFGRMADIEAEPSAIFVNAMNTGPFQADADVVAGDDPEGFQAGLDVLSTLTSGTVHLAVGADASDVLKQARNVSVSTFSGPHPAGNTSVHISRLAPMSPHDVVWTVQAADAVLIGRLFLDGALPETRVISLGGPGVKPDARQHYRVRVGSSLPHLLADRVVEGDLRIISGDALSGTPIAPGSGIPFCAASLTLLAEDRERHFLGWMMPGGNVRTHSRAFTSAIGGNAKTWSLGTSRNGGHRAMVLTGQYDRVMPLNILVDYLVRAVLANDTDEAIQLGILETAPEDFALCDFICPCKTEVQDIIRQGLEMIEEEGI